MDCVVTVGVRYLVYALCRETQTIYSSEREAALQAAQWARSLAAKIAHTHRQHSDRIFVRPDNILFISSLPQVFSNFFLPKMFQTIFIIASI